MIDLVTIRNMSPSALVFRFGLPAAVFLAVILAPNPEGLTDQGQRALAVMAMAVVMVAVAALITLLAGLVYRRRDAA